MNDSQAKHIAAQALKAMQLRRQLDRGELTQEAYLEYLNALDATPADDARPVPLPAIDTPEKTAPRLMGALEALQIRRRLEEGQLTPHEYLSQLNAVPDVPQAVAPEPAPLPARTPATAPAGRVGSVIFATRPSHAPQSHWNRWLLVASVGTFMLVAVLHALPFRGHAGAAPNSAAQLAAVTLPQDPAAGLALAEAVFAGSGERRKIAGVLKNVSGRSYADVQLTFAEIGDDGSTVGTAQATVEHIGPHQTAKFEAPGIKPKAVELVLQSMDGHAR